MPDESHAKALMLSAMRMTPAVAMRNESQVPGPAMEATTGIEINGAPDAPIFAIDWPRTAQDPRLFSRKPGLLGKGSSTAIPGAPSLSASITLSKYLFIVLQPDSQRGRLQFLAAIILIFLFEHLRLVYFIRARRWPPPLDFHTTQRSNRSRRECRRHRRGTGYSA